jgi:mono/diheme cytochrome c family protein
MPSSAHLFADGRGDDLVSYLKQSGQVATASLIEQSARWTPAGTPGGIDGRKLFATHCAPCHGAQGDGKGPLAGHFVKAPGNLTTEPFIWTTAGGSLEARVARVIKFGIPGADMPGHETLGDAEVLALTVRVLELRQQAPQYR